MIFGFHWALLLTGLLGVMFVGNGVVNAIGPANMRDGFRRWGFPAWWHLVNGAICLAIGALLFVTGLRPLGFALAALECFAIVLTLLWNREPGHLPPGIILLGLVGLAYWGLYGLTVTPGIGF